MPDDIDLIQEHEEFYRTVALRNRVAVDQPTLEECRMCGDEIPVARRAAVKGCQHCVECASLLEVLQPVR